MPASAVGPARRLRARERDAVPRLPTVQRWGHIPRSFPLVLPSVMPFPSATRLKASFIAPALPRPAAEPPRGPGWIHEIKHDGFRIMARRDERGVRLLTRNGYDFADRFPLITQAVEVLPVRSCFIDGEAIVVNSDGLSVYDLLRYRQHDGAAVLCAFDLIELDGRTSERAYRTAERPSRQSIAPGAAVAVRNHVERTLRGRRRYNLRACLQVWLRGDCIEAARLTLLLRPR